MLHSAHTMQGRDLKYIQVKLKSIFIDLLIVKLFA